MARDISGGEIFFSSMELRSLKKMLDSRDVYSVSMAMSMICESDKMIPEDLIRSVYCSLYFAVKKFSGSGPINTSVFYYPFGNVYIVYLKDESIEHGKFLVAMSELWTAKCNNYWAIKKQYIKEQKKKSQRNKQQNFSTKYDICKSQYRRIEGNVRIPYNKQQVSARKR